MDYLDTVDDRFEKEHEIEQIHEAEAPKPQKPVRTKRIVKREDASVRLIKRRMEDKLYSCGLNDKVINEVISYVLFDVNGVEGIQQPQQLEPQQQQQQQHVQESVVPQNGFSYQANRASSLLDGMDMRSHTPTIDPNQPDGMNEGTEFQQPQPQQPINMNNMADHASALL